MPQFVAFFRVIFCATLSLSRFYSTLSKPMYLVALSVLLGMCALAVMWTGLSLKCRSLFQSSSVSGLQPARIRPLGSNPILTGEQPAFSSKRHNHCLAAVLASQLVAI
eukprot:RCo038553